MAIPTKIPCQCKNKFPTHPPAHIMDSSTTIACNKSDTYSEAEKRIQQAVYEIRAPESAPVITDFARQYDVPYKTFHGTPAKFDIVQGNRQFLDVEEKAKICWYLDRLDKPGLPAQGELRGAADYFLRQLDASFYS